MSLLAWALQRMASQCLQWHLRDLAQVFSTEHQIMTKLLGTLADTGDVRLSLAA